MSNSPILPLFYSHSTRRSILTYWTEKESTEGGPASIIQLCQKAGLKECYGISTNFHDYLEAWKNLKAKGINFRFGLELKMCENAKEKTEESRKSEHKIVIWMKNSNGYKDLCKIYSACHTNVDNRYYTQRFDYQQLNPMWTDNLMLSLPFFDSFLFVNSMKFGASIVPQMPTKPVIFREVNSGLPFDAIIQEAINRYNKGSEFEEVKTKTIYYEKYTDFDSYITYRAIQNQSTFNVPNLDFMSSPNFCFEDYMALNQGGVSS
jgi:DNA polymerase III alpha subunit